MAIDQVFLDNLFPAERTNEFFEALFGDVDEGAYDIKLALHEQSADTVIINYELHGRPNKCLACNLTSGLPHVFTRHPIIASAKTAEAIAKEAGFESFEFSIGATNQLSQALHLIPLIISKK